MKKILVLCCLLLCGFKCMEAGSKVFAFKRSTIDASTPILTTLPSVSSALSCSSRCKSTSKCCHFDYNILTKDCIFYGAETATDPTGTLSVYSNTKRITIVFQDVTGRNSEDYFPGGTVDVDTPTRYSIATQMEDYRWKSDGKFYLLMCYPGRFDSCLYFTQSNNLFDGSPRAGFELLNTPVPEPDFFYDFVGLASVDSTSRAMANGNPNTDKWFFAVGVKALWEGGTIPGPPTKDASNRWLRFEQMFLYAVTET